MFHHCKIELIVVLWICYFGQVSFAKFLVDIKTFKEEVNLDVCVDGAGEFHKSPEFQNVCDSDFVCKHPEWFAPTFLYCLGTVIANESIQEFCGCDCKFAHGASGKSEACLRVPGRDLPIACNCTYTDKDENPSKVCQVSSDSESILSPITGEISALQAKLHRNATRKESETLSNHDIKTMTMGDTGSEIERLGIGDVCKPGMDTVITLVCALGPIVGPGGVTLYGTDICGMDCFCSHGSTTPPYGVCVSKGLFSVCYCIL